MNEQDKPLALELAEMLEYHGATCEQIEAAKELRRLHAENEELKKQSVLTLGVIEELKTIARFFDIENDDLHRDAERLDWLLSKMPGDALRYVAGYIADTSSEIEFRAAIDAAMEKEKC